MPKFATELPTTYLFDDLTPNESLLYSLIVHYNSIDHAIQTLNPFLSRTTTNNLKHSLVKKQYLTRTSLTPRHSPRDLPNPPVTNATITTKIGRPKKCSSNNTHLNS